MQPVRSMIEAPTFGRYILGAVVLLVGIVLPLGLMITKNKSIFTKQK